MSNDRENNGVLGKIVTAVVIALLVGSTSPWWVEELKKVLVNKPEPKNETKLEPKNETKLEPKNETKPRLREDCLTFNTNNVRLQTDHSRWLLTDDKSRMILFDNQQEAQKSLNIIKNYGINSHCFVGRPDPSLEYWLVGGRAPRGSILNEDCISFNLSDIAVTQVNGRWKIVEGGRHSMFDFADKESEARQALAIIKKYGFTYSCFVGRPNPDFQYLRN